MFSSQVLLYYIYYLIIYILTSVFPFFLMKLPTINGLDASAVIVWKLEVFCIKPLVERSHDGRRVVRMFQTQSMTQLMDRYQENIISFREKGKKWEMKSKLSLPITSFFILPSLTSLIHIPCGPRFSKVKVRVSPNAMTRKVSMSQKATLTIKWCAVPMETFWEGQHDVCVLVNFASDLTERDFSERQRDGTLPHSKGFSDGIKRRSFTHFGRVVLYAVVEDKEKINYVPFKTKYQTENWFMATFPNF